MKHDQDNLDESTISDAELERAIGAQIKALRRSWNDTFMRLYFMLVNFYSPAK